MTCASFRSSHCGAQGAVGDRSAAMRRANSRGVRYPRLLCGRSSLYSSLHAAIFLRASNRFPNQLAFKHSSRNFPWKLSTNAFCTGRPGSICTNSIFRSSAHARKCRLVNSGPLSQRIASGAPRSATIFSSSRVTRRLGNPLSASSVKHSRVYTSITLNTRNFLPLSAASCTKSNAHSWFALVTTGLEIPARRNRFLLFLRISSPASRYTRYTFLWFTCKPFSTSFVRNTSSFLRFTYRWLDSATFNRSQIRRWLTRNLLHSQRTSSLRSTSSTRFFQSPLSASPCPDSNPPPASSAARFHLPAVAAAALLPRSSRRTWPSTRRRCASILPAPAPPPPRSCPLPSASTPRSSPLRYTSSSPCLHLHTSTGPATKAENHIPLCAENGGKVTPIGGGGGYNGGGGEGPKPRTFPWPLLPLGFFQDNSRQTLKLNRATCTEKGSGLVELQCWWSSPTQTFSSLGATRCTYPASDEGPGRCVNDHVVNGDTTISCAPDITIDQKCNDSTVQGPFFIYVTHRVGRPQ